MKIKMVSGGSDSDIDIKNATYKYWASHSSAETVDFGFAIKKVIFSFYYAVGSKMYCRIWDKNNNPTKVHTYINGEDKGETNLSDAEFSVSGTSITIKAGAQAYLQIWAM